MTPNEGDPPDQYVLDELERVPPSRRQLIQFLRRTGLSDLHARRFVEVLDETQTTITPYKSPPRRRRPPIRDIKPDDVAVKVTTVQPVAQEQLPSRTSASELTINSSGITRKKITHEVGHHPSPPTTWDLARAFLSHPKIAKVVVLAVAGMAADGHLNSLPEPTSQPSEITTFGIPETKAPETKAPEAKKPRRAAKPKQPWSLDKFLNDPFAPQ